MLIATRRRRRIQRVAAAVSYIAFLVVYYIMVHSS